MPTVITLGNGQLGTMLGKAAKTLEIPFEAVAIPDAWNLIADGQNILVTFEQEYADEKLLCALRDKEIPSFPSWKSFFLLRSKKTQKDFLLQSTIKSAPYLSAQPWTDATSDFIRAKKGAVLKAGKGGYDGKGVWLVDENGNTKEGPAAQLAARLEEPYVEERIPFDFEVAAVVCRSKTGAVESYPTVRSVQKDGICSEIEFTREFAESTIAKKAAAIARTVAEKLDYVGILAVECFVRGDEILVNEIAPRVHNSGHFTIDVCAGSQFENHLRAGLGMPLLSTAPTHSAALMVNLLWPKEAKEFAPLFARLTCGPSWPENAKLHWYGKSEIRPLRKMGHFTVYGKTLLECREVADQILASRWSQG